jgi:N-acylglucosamine 2-epimerase
MRKGTVKSTRKPAGRTESAGARSGPGTLTEVDAAPRREEAMSLSRLPDLLQAHLFQEIVPFWERVGPDPGGGFNTCVADDGWPVSRDKFLWGQWRAAWVFARLYNGLRPEPRWLALAESIAAFAIRHGWDDEASGWRSRLAADGRILDGYTSIYTDGFAMYALGELIRATGRPEYETWARRTADAVIEKLKQPHDTIPHDPYPIPEGARVHGIPMLFSLKFQELGDALGEPRYLETAGALHDEVFERFYRPEWDLLVERVAEDGSLYPGPEGRAVVPGHVIEDMWFQIHVAKAAGRTDRIEKAVELIRRHLEFGWDESHGGGLLLARDAEGKSPVGWNLPDLKLWWPHTEALYACLLAWRETGVDWALEWYRKVLNYSMRHFYMPEVGEWRQKLTREGTPFEGTVVYPVKDPFHLPRSLILQIELLRAL